VKFSPIPISISDLEPRTNRSKGLHASDIIKHLLVHWDPKRFGGEVDETTRKLWLTGFVFEQAMSSGLAALARGRNSRLVQLELEEEGVFRTIDTFDTEKWKVVEYKSTEMSSRHPITSYRFWHWMIQIKDYCSVAGTQEAELYVLFMRGDYKEKRRDLKAWELKFTERELRENQVMMRNARRDMERKGR
jgi:hypothetical protein